MAERPEDTRLLAALARALSGDTPAPPPEGLAALHAAVDRRSMGQTDPQPARPFGWAWGPLANLRWRRPAGVAAIMAGSLVAGGGVAFASGAPVPPPIRELATHLGLPVTPQPVVNVHNTESSLSKALEEAPTSRGAGVTGTVNSSISHYAGTLRQQVSELTPAQRHNEDAKAQHLLDQAARQDEQGSGTSRGQSGNGQSPSGQSQDNQGQDQNGQGQNLDNHSGTQHGSTGGGDHSGGSRSSGNQNEQGAGGADGVRYYNTRSYFSTTTAALSHRRGDNNTDDNS